MSFFTKRGLVLFGAVLALGATAGCGGDDSPPPNPPSAGKSGHAGGGVAGAHGGGAGRGAGRGGSVQGGAGADDGDGGTGGSNAGRGGSSASGKGGGPGSGGDAGVGGGSGRGGTGGTPSVGGAGNAPASGGSAGELGGAAGDVGAGGAASDACSDGPGADCPCIKLAPTGDDADGAQSGGATPFLTFQAAVDYASAHPDVATTVCVAAGAACGSHGTFSAPSMHMRDRVSVYGNYESTGWTRCADSTTELTPYAVEGVSFGSDIVHATRLDGVVITNGGGDAAAFVSGVTVDASAGARLEGVEIHAGTAAHLAGVNVVNGGRLAATGLKVYVNTGAVDTFGIRVVSSFVTLDASSVNVSGSATVAGVELSEAAGSRVSSSHVTVGTNYGALSSGVGVHVAGDATAIELNDNVVSATGPYYALTGIDLDPCTGDVVVSGNTVTASNPTEGYASGQPAVAGIHVSGTCTALLSENKVSSVGGLGIDNVGVSCAAPCTLEGGVVSVDKSGLSPGTQGSAVGVGCSGCVALKHSAIIGLVEPSGLHTGTGFTSTGLVVVGPTLVAGNSITGGCSGVAVGVHATNARLENNSIGGRAFDGSCGITPPYASSSTGLVADGGSDVHSNYIRGAFAPTGVGLSTNPSVIVRNNEIVGNPTALSGAFAVLENNTFLGSVGGLTTDAEVNALPGAAANFFGGCGAVDKPCVDAGTTVGAPSDDMYGTPRDAHPDIGPIEDTSGIDVCVGQSCPLCVDVTCGGHGTCLESQGAIQCACDVGYQLAPGEDFVCVLPPCVQNPCDSLTICTPHADGTRECGACPLNYTGDGYTGCVDVDECATNHGDCDPLVTCLNYPGSSGCGSCPPGYSGNGYSGCYISQFCTPNPCTHDASCASGTDDYSCACPAGTMAQDCSVTFSALSGGWWYFCGIRTDGTLGCWGRDTSTTLAPPSGVFARLSAGYDSACAIRPDKSLVCWGSNENGKGTAPGGTFLDVGVGFHHTCAVKEDQTVTCWGSNQYGESSAPSGSFIAVDASQNYSCGIHADGTLACWGYNLSGQSTPPAGTYQALSLGPMTACAIATDQSITCWGDSSEGKRPPPGGTFASLELGGAFAVARATDGTYAHWGRTTGGLGSQVGTFTAVGAAGDTACGVRTFGNVTCMGANDYGQGTAPSGPP